MPALQPTVSVITKNPQLKVELRRTQAGWYWCFVIPGCTTARTPNDGPYPTASYALELAADELQGLDMPGIEAMADAWLDAEVQ